MESDDLPRLLQPPVTARWQDIRSVRGGKDTGELLIRLQTLTTLNIHYVEHVPNVDFLAQLPHLTSLTLDCDHLLHFMIPADAVLAPLLRCPGLTELDLICGFNSRHWSALFAKLTRIKKLTIHGGELQTLRCFSSGPITQSLEELSLDLLEVPLSHLKSLYNLRRLRILHLNQGFFQRLDDATTRRHSPPTRLLPALTELHQSWIQADGTWDDSKRESPSFEWMQQLTK